MSARILVVDDVLPNVKLLAAKLTREYFDVVTAYSGPEALERIRSDSPDIVLLDVMMPGMDGFEVCERIRADPATTHIPVVMVTALSDTSDRVRGLQAGADDFLTKPVNDLALFARVRSLVRLKMTIDEWRARESTWGQLGMLPGATSMQGEPIEGANILVVEDRPSDIRKIEETLAHDRHRVTVCTDPAEAIDLVAQQDFDLTVISLTLQDADGLRLVSHLRSQERTRHVPILLISEESDLERTTKGLDVGATDYLIRPLDRHELIARARTQIRRKRFQERLRTNYEHSLSMALTDPLTAVFNRRYVAAHLPRLVDRANAAHKPLALIMLDIDHFKHVNDTFGHLVGDQVLVEVAERISRHLRNFDLVARLGGEEFLIIMPETDADTAALIAERLRTIVSQTEFTIGQPPRTIPVTISLGIAVLKGPSRETPEDLIRRADEALYTAKRGGRDRYVIASDSAG